MANRSEAAVRAFNPNPGCANRPTLLLLVLALCAPLVSAQARSAQNRIRQPRTTAPRSLAPENPPPRENAAPRPLVASLSSPSLPPRPEYGWETEPRVAPLPPPSVSFRKTVNFNLLLPPSPGRLPVWTTVPNKEGSLFDRDLIAPPAFSVIPPAPVQGKVNPFVDPQYYARRIPGVGPIVDRVLKQSQSHPRLTRVLKSIQPQF